MWLKIIAAILMLIDHFAFIFKEQMSPDLYYLLRLVGRLAFPAFAFLIALGMKRTRNLPAYFFRIAGMGLLIDVVMKVASRFMYIDFNTNVLITFACAILLIIGIHFLVNGFPDILGLMKVSPAGAASSGTSYVKRIHLFDYSVGRKTALFIAFILISISLLVCYLLKPDYSYYGLLTVASFYYFLPEQRDENSVITASPASSNDYIKMFLTFLVINIVYTKLYLDLGVTVKWAFLQAFSLFSLPLFPLAFTGKRPSRAFQYFFYLYYPLHLLILFALHEILY